MRLTPANGFEAAEVLGTPEVGVEGGAPVPRLALTIFRAFSTSALATCRVPRSSSCVGK